MKTKQRKKIEAARDLMVKKLKELNHEIGQMTGQWCHQCPKANLPSRCCDDLMCIFVQVKLKSKGIHVQETGNPHARFLGNKGCVIPPEFRPVCARHLCQQKQKELIGREQENYLEWQKVQKKIDYWQDCLIKANESLGVQENLKDIPF